MNGASFWSDTIPRAISIYAIVVFVVLWVGFVVSLLVNQAWLDLVWGWVGDLPLVIRVMVWVFFLPVMVLLWIWESSWSAFWRFVGYAGIVAWTFLALSGLNRAMK